MRLRWQESGGPPVTPPGRKGFGSRLIEGGLAQDLDGVSSMASSKLYGVASCVSESFAIWPGPVTVTRQLLRSP
jgi:hypothetical protein